MRARILSIVVAVFVAVITFASAAVLGLLAAVALPIRGEIAAAAVLGGSLLLAMHVFRSAHDWLIFRWSNEERPPMYLRKWNHRRMRDYFLG